MKLQSELRSTIEAMHKIGSEQIEEYAKSLKAKGDYINFQTRLSWDVLRAAVGTEVICEWYRKYRCNDTHIATLAKSALAEVCPQLF